MRVWVLFVSLVIGLCGECDCCMGLCVSLWCVWLNLCVGGCV